MPVEWRDRQIGLYARNSPRYRGGESGGEGERGWDYEKDFYPWERRSERQSLRDVQDFGVKGHGSGETLSWGGRH